MKNKLIITVIFLALSVTYFSCDDLTGPVSDVTGNVYGFNYVSITNLKVTINDRSVYTSENGNFRISNVNVPYDITVTDSVNRHVTLFKGLTAANVSLQIESNIINEPALVFVKFPEKIIQPDLSGKIIFTDGDRVSSYGYINTFDTSGSYLQIDLNEPVTGRLIALIYKRDNTGKIISYEHFGKSPVFLIERGKEYSYEFDSLGLKLNPGEADVNGSFLVPPTTPSVIASFYLSFSEGEKNYFSSNAFSGIGLNNFNFKIPTGLPVQFRTIVENESYGIGSSFSKFTVNPDAQNYLEVHLPPSLVSPAEGAVNVNINTQLSFDGGTGNGVYLITLNNSSRFVTYSIVTSENGFTLKDLEDLGFGRINNNSFSWLVRKAGPVNSVNDYVTVFPGDHNSFILSSGHRFFSTEP
ncbi:MAG: carboxypeptidase regulatory-like domain-containing protein [Ignavibacteria bacterium]|nr:carboxypeptidase regulatory-like domain-containing protein [Ignavibacteria bacterium]